jgi:predicted transcriptional regulator
MTKTPRERLNAYRDARSDLPAAVAAAWASGMPQTEIARESGLSREGVRKILNRQEIPMRTLTIDATAGAVQAVMADLWPGQMQPGIGGGAYVEVTLTEDKATELEGALERSGYPVH